ncbi:hypothetical protein [Phenylobacterium sp.]|uniref:hypothetical protein n=1 Tax=Phenylobacterium sp. TaxID=1871053 RepID=UPI0035B04268
MQIAPLATPRAAASAVPQFAADARRDAARPALPDRIDYALLRRPDRALDKPVAFASLAELARAIHRARAGRAIQLLNVALQLRGEPTPRRGVSVWTLADDGARCAYIGWAWLNGGDRHVLQGALFAAQPIATAA